MAKAKKGSKDTKETKDGAAAPKDKKEAALDRAVSEIEKQFGKGSIMRLGDDTHATVPSISTGSISLDIALGVGGIPRGRICEIYGPESSGKTTLCYHVMGNAQKMGGTAAFIDTEHALDPGYAESVGVDTQSLLVSQPDSGEQAWTWPRCSSAATPSTWWWSTPSPRSCRGPRSKARWATRTWASRRA